MTVRLSFPGAGNASFPAAVLLLAALRACPAAGEELCPNGSFEAGGAAPAGWLLHEGSRWERGDARRGERHLSGMSDGGAMVAESEPIPLGPLTDYRLAGWLRSPAGVVRFGAELLDASGQVIAGKEAPPLPPSPSWAYVAMEWSSEGAQGVRLRFWVEGRADLDDVSLTEVAASCLGNPGVEGDARGRIPYWSEEGDDTLLPGGRGGTHRPDREIRRGGKMSVELEVERDWYAVSSVNYPVPAWTDRFQLWGWMRTKGAATAQILACWMDDRQRVLRVDASAPVRAEDWEVLHPEGVLEPPAAALTVRLVAAARGGHAWFDDFGLLALRPRRPVVEVFINQIGYELRGPKSAVVATNFFPPERAAITFRLLGPGGGTAWEAEVVCSGRIHPGTADDWGWYFWRADFSTFREEGVFRAVATAGTTRGESPPFAIGPGRLLAEAAQPAVDFFFVQRCGFEVPGWHKACHLDDARLPDGTHLDATGGWHSAGDYNKPMWQFGDGAAVYALATAFAARRSVFEKHDRDADGLADALAEAWWGASFLAKMQEPAEGSLRGDVLQGPGRDWMRWTAPESHTDNISGTADDPVIAPGRGNSPLAIAGWARLSRLLGERGIENDTLERARRLWEFSVAQAGAGSDPLLAISALELYRATGEARFHEFLRAAAGALLEEQTASGRWRGETGGHGDLTAAALALFALEIPADPLGPRVRAALERYLEFALSRTENPFGLSRQGEEERDASFFHPTVGLGVNFWLLARAWAALLVYRVTGDGRALVYASDQLDWVLGKNPLGLCMFEGRGTRNPPRYHHRYNAIPGRERGAVPGAIPNGMLRDMGLADRPGFDLSRGSSRAPSFRPNEPWLVHNVFYLLVASELPAPGE